PQAARVAAASRAADAALMAAREYTAPARPLPSPAADTPRRSGVPWLPWSPGGSPSVALARGPEATAQASPAPPRSRGGLRDELPRRGAGDPGPGARRDDRRLLAAGSALPRLRPARAGAPGPLGHGRRRARRRAGGRRQRGRGRRARLRAHPRRPLPDRADGPHRRLRRQR